MKKVLFNQRGSILVEFALVFCIYMGVVLMLLIHGLWLYNSFQADRAAREAALYYGRTNNYSMSQAIAIDHLRKTQVATTINDVSLYWSGSNSAARVTVEMTTFFPGIPKLLNPKGSNWVGKVPIIKEAITPGEHHNTNSVQYNR